MVRERRRRRGRKQAGTQEDLSRSEITRDSESSQSDGTIAQPIVRDQSTGIRVGITTG